MSSVLNDSGLAGLLDSIEDQASSGCVNIELFTATVQAMRMVCENFDTQQAQLDDMQDQITLCCSGGGGGTGTGSTISVCGELNSVSADTSTYGECNIWVDADLTMTGTNGDNNAGANFISTGDVVVYCGTLEVAREAYSLTALNVGNGASFSDSQSISFTGLDCVGPITVVTENVSGASQTTLTTNGCINGTCV